MGVALCWQTADVADGVHPSLGLKTVITGRSPQYCPGELDSTLDSGRAPNLTFWTVCTLPHRPCISENSTCFLQSRKQNNENGETNHGSRPATSTQLIAAHFFFRKVPGIEIPLLISVFSEWVGTCTYSRGDATAQVLARLVPAPRGRLWLVNNLQAIECG